jgi:hypothetical protein
MTIQTQTDSRAGFDIEAFVRAYESWDIPTLEASCADDVSVTIVSPDSPPASPMVHQGKAAVRQIWEQASTMGVRVRIERSLVGETGAAFTFVCEFPNGSVVVANAILDIVDGLIVREHEVLVGGAAAGVLSAG